MKRILKFTLIFIGITFSISMHAQKRTEDFSISFPDTKLEKATIKTSNLLMQELILHH